MHEHTARTAATPSSFTVQGWLKGDDGQSVTGNQARLVEKTDGFAEGGGWGIDWAPGATCCGIPARALGSIGFGIRGESGSGGFATAGSYLSQQQWIFFAVTYDGTAATNNVKFYRGTTSQALQLVAQLLALAAVVAEGGYSRHLMDGQDQRVLSDINPNKGCHDCLVYFPRGILSRTRPVL